MGPAETDSVNGPDSGRLRLEHTETLSARRFSIWVGAKKVVCAGPGNGPPPPIVDRRDEGDSAPRS